MVNTEQFQSIIITQTLLCFSWLQCIPLLVLIIINIIDFVSFH